MTTVIPPQFRSTHRRSPSPLQPLASLFLSLPTAPSTTTTTKTAMRTTLFWALLAPPEVAAVLVIISSLTKTMTRLDKDDKAAIPLLSCIDFTIGSQTIGQVSWLYFVLFDSKQKSLNVNQLYSHQPAAVLPVLVVLVILELKSFWSNPRSVKVSLPRWQTVLKWTFILLNVVLVLGLVGLSVRKQQESFSWIFDFFDKKEKVPRVVALRIAKHCSDKNLFLYVQLAPIGVALVRIRGCVRSERQRVGSIAVLVPPWAVQELLLPSWPVHRKSTYPCVSFTPSLFSISQNKVQHLIRQRFIDESAFFSHFFALYFNILTSRLEISISVSTNRLMRTMEATKSWSTSTQRDLAATLSVPSL